MEISKSVIKNMDLYEQKIKRNNSTNLNKPPISGSKRNLPTINKRFNEAMKEMEQNNSQIQEESNRLYKKGRMEINSYNKHRIGHSSKLTIPMHIS